MLNGQNVMSQRYQDPRCSSTVFMRRSRKWRAAKQIHVVNHTFILPAHDLSLLQLKFVCLWKKSTFSLSIKSGKGIRLPFLVFSLLEFLRMARTSEHIPNFPQLPEMISFSCPSMPVCHTALHGLSFSHCSNSLWAENQLAGQISDLSLWHVYFDPLNASSAGHVQILSSETKVIKGLPKGYQKSYEWGELEIGYSG